MDGVHQNHVIILTMPLNSLMMLLEIDRTHVVFPDSSVIIQNLEGRPLRGPTLMAILLGRAP